MGISTSRLQKGVSINVLDRDKSSIFIHTAEQADKYMTLCSSSHMNSIARNDCTYAVGNISLHDRDVLQDLLRKYSAQMPQRLIYDLDTIHIVTLMPSADSGMPHTRPDNIVCIPLSQSNPSYLTFVHELWHVHQRKYADDWIRLYRGAWRFDMWHGELPADLERARRLNPDTVYAPLFIWKNTWVPIPIFQSPTRPRLSDCAVWYYNVHTGNIHHDMPREWKSFFFSDKVPLIAYEHPNEISAYFLSTFNEDSNGPPAWNSLKRAMGITSILFSA